MDIRLKQVLLVMLCFAMIGNSGCTTTHNVYASPEALAEKKIKVGDKVTVHYTSGHSEIVKLTEIGEESLSGVADDGRSVELDYDDLLSLEHKDVHVLKTAGAAVGVVALGAVLVGAVAVGSMAAMAGGF
ncbi:MAG: hypothetical protein ACR2QL_08965 [Woeseiaceae bacterium]